jgi:molybdopterin-guanine dinucleotide biosynthesis protein A
MSRSRKSTVPGIHLVSGFVLAGGASSRMGRPKALLVLNGETMLERQLRLLRCVSGKVSVAGWPGGMSITYLPASVRRVPLLLDEPGDRGPLGGIYSALKRSRTEYNLFLGCDMPFVTAEFLEYLCRAALRTRADVTVPKSVDRRLNPVCAVYRRRALREMHASLELGERKISRLFFRIHTQVIPWREIACAGFPPAIFDNMNTPEDYERAKKYCGQ